MADADSKAGRTLTHSWRSKPHAGGARLRRTAPVWTQALSEQSVRRDQAHMDAHGQRGFGLSYRIQESSGGDRDARDTLTAHPPQVYGVDRLVCRGLWAARRRGAAAIPPMLRIGNTLSHCAARRSRRGRGGMLRSRNMALGDASPNLASKYGEAGRLCVVNRQHRGPTQGMGAGASLSTGPSPGDGSPANLTPRKR